MPATASQPATVPADRPLAERFLRAPAYPLRGAALATLAALSVAHALVDLLPGIISLAGGVVVWASIILYAMECLRHTADGYADPPEITLYSNYGPAVSMLMLQVLGFIAMVLALKYMPGLWLVVIVLMALLPSIAMSLAFEDHLVAALNPMRWARVMGTFGAAYLVAVAVGGMEDLAYVGYIASGGWIARLAWFTAVVYLCLLQYHVLGALMHRHHEAFGHTPESEVLAQASGRDNDDHLLERARTLSDGGEHHAAEALLRDRLRERLPPLKVFAAHRDLLRQRGDSAALLQAAHTHLARLLSEDKLRPALGLIGECIELDPNFLPDQPDSAARLADAAAAQGMNQLALKLARGFPNTWPRDPRAPHYGLLAAQLLHARFQRTAEASVLAGKLLSAYPDHPERARIEAFLSSLGSASGSGSAGIAT